MIPNYRNRAMADCVRRLLYKHVHFRQAVLIAIAVCACAVMTYTVHVLRSRTLVIKLHNSEETFVEEALHEIVLVPEKLAPRSSETPEEIPTEQRCESLFKAKGRHCTRGRNTGEVPSMQESKILNSKDLALEEEKEDGGGGGGREERREDGEGSLGGRVGTEEDFGLGGFELPVKEIWPARRRDWRDDEEIQRVSRVLAVNALYRRNVDIMRVKLPPRLPNFRNPCFLANPRDLTLCRSGAFKTWERFARGNKLGAANKGKRRLSCLPYFVIAGMPQTGATELMHLLSRHPDVTVPLPLQSHWMDSARFEESCGSVNAYLDFFGPTAQAINASVNDRGVHTLVAGEVAEDIMWNNHVWPALPGNEGQMEPRYTNADYLHHLDPDVKVIVILRNPTERLYEEYWANSVALEYEPSADDFNTRVVWKLDVLRTCLRTEPLRTCVYDGVQESRDSAVRIRTGMYHVMLQDWLRVFPRDQVHVINYDTLHENTRKELTKIIHFLQLSHVSKTEVEKAVMSLAGDLRPRKESWSEAEEMMPDTRTMLDNFYEPFNKFLATLLENESFMWRR